MRPGEPSPELPGQDDAHGTGVDRHTFLASAAAAFDARHGPDSAAGPPVDPGLEAFQALLEEADDPLALRRKPPRRLHLWFAVGLGLLGACAALAQGLLQRAPVHTPANPAADGAGVAGDTPSLAPLGQALREPLEAGTAPLAAASAVQAAPVAPLPASPLAAKGVTADRSSGLAALATDPQQSDLPADLLELPGVGGSAWLAGSDGAGRHPAVPADPTRNATAADAARYEQEKARSLIAGSHILAISHVSAGSNSLTSGDPGPTASPAGPLAGFGRLGDALQSSPALLSAAGNWLRQALPGADGKRGPMDSAYPSATAAGAGGGTAIPGALAIRPPTGTWLVLEGTAIPCVLVNELRSDLPGMILAQVTQDVFDSVSAQVRLIPRGTRLVGRYDSQVSAGQQRVMASFHRLIFPDGSSIDLNRMEAADPAGGAGLQDQVDTHFWDRFGFSFLTAGIARVAERPSASIAAPGGSVLPTPDATGQILLDTARAGLQTQGNLPPTLVIQRGHAFQVMVNRDLPLPPLTETAAP